MGSAPFRYREKLAERWLYFFGGEIPRDITFSEMFPEMCGVQPGLRLPDPPTEDDSAALNDADAALAFLRILYLSGDAPEVLDHEDRDSIIFMCGWAAGICEATFGLRPYEVVAERGFRTGISAGKATDAKHEQCLKKHDEWAQALVSLRKEDPSLSAHSAAPKIKEICGAKETADWIRKKLGEYETKGWLFDIEDEKKNEGL